MPTRPRLAAFAFVSALATTAIAASNEALPKNSPFSTPDAVAPTAITSNENYELAAISTIGAKTTVNIYDKAAKKGRWIRVGETVDGIAVRRFDPAQERVTIAVGNAPEKTLSLRHGTGPTTGPVVSTPVAAHDFPPAPGAAGVSNAAPGGVTQPAQTPQLIAPAGTATPTQPTPPAPGSLAHQEQEARMLVSDLLEIGMAQRKAYEDAQRKSAEAAQQAAQKSQSASQPPAPVASEKKR